MAYSLSETISYTNLIKLLVFTCCTNIFIKIAASENTFIINRQVIGYICSKHLNYEITIYCHSIFFDPDPKRANAEGA